MVRSLKHAGRRAFLRGVGGSALALPFLEFTHGHLWAAETGANLRFLTVFSHGGTISNQSSGGTGRRHDGTGSSQGNDWWRPSDPSSEDLVLGPIHQPLEPWRSKLLVLEGINNQAAIEQDPYRQGAHGLANQTALTAAVRTDAGPQGASIDQVVAQRLAARQPVPFDSIHLEVSGHQYGTPYFRGPGESVSGETSPAAAFSALFAGVGTGEPDPELERKLAARRSILDGLQEGYAQFHDRVSVRDRHAIAAHLDHLNSLEKQLGNAVVCTPPEPTDVEDGSGDIVGPLHASMIVAAIRCGLTNVANLEIADILTPWTPTGIPTNQPRGHSLGHMAREVGPTGEDAHLLDVWLAEMLDNRRWRMSLMAQILEGLDDPNFMEGDRTILDNSLVLYTSEFREPSKHIAHNVPVLLAGSAGGYFRTGRFIDYNKHAAADPYTLDYETTESTHNLFTSILQAMGEDDEHFGSDHAVRRGPLAGLT